MTTRMQTKLDCLPCLLRQVLDAARQVTDDEEVQRAVMDQVSQALRLVDSQRSPPAMAQQIHRIIRATIGENPYGEINDRMNRLGVAMRERLRARVAAAPEPFVAAVRVAIAASCIDFGTDWSLVPREVTKRLEAALDLPLHGPVADLQRAAQQARRILYLTDNTGEIALDRLLIEHLPRGAVTVAVRGRPVINDATLADARAVGLAKWSALMDNGSDAPGTLLTDCSKAFQTVFAQADLIIAKGQGNYESLVGTRNRPIYFLLIPKCPLVAQHLGEPEDTLVVCAASSVKKEKGGGTASCNRSEPAGVT